MQLVCPGTDKINGGVNASDMDVIEVFQKFFDIILMQLIVEN
jgi:hypothetical protein